MNITKPVMFAAATLLTLASFTLTAPAQAREPVVVSGIRSDVPIRYVTYADLNLASTAGERTLTHRVGYAINDVCIDSGYENTRSFGYSNCKDHGLKETRPQIARAVERAKEIAMNGKSAILPVTILLSAQ